MKEKLINGKITKEEWKEYLADLDKRIAEGDTSALDEKFSLMDRRTADSMTGTGTGLGKVSEHTQDLIYGWLRRTWLTKEDADYVSKIVKSEADGKEFLKLFDKLNWKSLEDYYEEYNNGNYKRDIKYLLDECKKLAPNRR